MSGLAKLSLHFGAKVSGSDSGASPQLEALRGLGIEIHTSHCADNISGDIDVLVFSGAIKDGNPELVSARELGLIVMERSEFLGEISKCFKKVIAISGTHGKTTTTAILGLIMRYAGLNPTIHLGGESNDLHGNTIIGGEEYFLLEACEYRESFKYLRPYIGVITNIDLDHIDYYGNMDNIRKAFCGFASNCDKLIIDVGANIPHSDVTIINQDWQVKDVEYMLGGYNFNVYYLGKHYWTFRLNSLGMHNISNALFAIAVAHSLGIEKDVMERAIADFKGVERRYETIATLDGGCKVIVDYAHHPTEIRSSIEGIRGAFDKILYVFQPHTYSRTLGLFEGFKEVLDNVEDIIIYKTYPAREEYIAGGDARDLYAGLSVKNKAYIDSIERLIRVIDINRNKCDCVLVLGAGDLADKLKEYYR